MSLQINENTDVNGGTGRTVHLSGYQNRDREIVDYQMYELSGTGLQFRGPEHRIGHKYIAFVGAAQTFGCFCEHPFPIAWVLETRRPSPVRKPSWLVQLKKSGGLEWLGATT